MENIEKKSEYYKWGFEFMNLFGRADEEGIAELKEFANEGFKLLSAMAGDCVVSKYQGMPIDERLIYASIGIRYDAWWANCWLRRSGEHISILAGYEKA